MTEEVEEILDRDFLQFITLAKTYYTQLFNEKDKSLCMQWLTKLCGEKIQGIPQKRKRNIYLTQLLMNMQQNKIAGPFLISPSDGPLPPARSTFSPDDSDKIDLSKIVSAFGKMPENFQELSPDGQTYIAIRSLPNDQGTFAFVGLNINKKKPCVSSTVFYPHVNKKSKSCCMKPLGNVSTTTSLAENVLEDQKGGCCKKDTKTKVPGNIIQLYQSLHKPQTNMYPTTRQDNGIAFFKTLLKQIDMTIKGVECENNIIEFLVNRLEKDLKKEPKMEYLFHLTPAQRDLKLLEILRQKVVVRLQEEKRRILMTEMEQRMKTSSINFQSCINRSEKAAELIWELAVTRPLTDNDINKLCELYPEEVISTFLDLLVLDRQVILKGGRKRQVKIMEDMRHEIYKEIESEKAAYNKSRETYREWNEILSMVEEMIYEAKSEIVESDQAIEPQQEEILANMIADIKETENLIIEEAHVGEILTEKIVEANMWTSSIHEDDERKETWEMKSAIENMKKQSKIYEMLIKKQEKRIKQLNKTLSSSQR